MIYYKDIKPFFFIFNLFTIDSLSSFYFSKIHKGVNYFTPSALLKYKPINNNISTTNPPKPTSLICGSSKKKKVKYFFIKETNKIEFINFEKDSLSLILISKLSFLFFINMKRKSEDYCSYTKHNSDFNNNYTILIK